MSALHGLVNGNNQVERVYLIRKEGMTTRDFFHTARFLNYDRKVLMNSSVAFANVGDAGFNTSFDSLFATNFGGLNATQYTVESEDEIPVLAQTLASQTEKNLKIFLINVDRNVNNKKINKLSKLIQEGAKAQGVSKYVMGILGVKSNDAPRHHLNLNEVETQRLPLSQGVR
jgi:hypothetical protein